MEFLREYLPPVHRRLQRENKAFGFGDGKIFLSEDNAKSWAHSAAFPDAANITFRCLLKNGNILFATRQKLFLSTDNLKSHREIVVKNRDGSDYRPHTPQNDRCEGWQWSLPRASQIGSRKCYQVHRSLLKRRMN